MHQAPKVNHPREVFDSHGQLIGSTVGFRPDPGTGSLGLELELCEETIQRLEAKARSVWVPETQVMAVRRDRMMLDISLHELQRYVRQPQTEIELVDDPEHPVRA